MTILFQDDFTNTEVVDGLLTGWSEGVTHHLTRPETVGFELIGNNRALRITAPGTLPTHRATSIWQVRYEPEYWGSEKVLFPLDFEMTSANKWFGFCSIMYEYNHRALPDHTASSNMTFSLQLWGNDLELVIKHSKTLNGVQMPGFPIYFRTGIHVQRGVMHVLKYHILKDPVNGLAEAWFDGVKILDYHGSTWHFSNRNDWMPMKSYTEADESMKTHYYDDIIYATSEADLEEPTPTPSIIPILAGAGIGFAVGQAPGAVVGGILGASIGSLRFSQRLTTIEALRRQMLNSQSCRDYRRGYSELPSSTH
ncbi:hypothetical protein ES702_00361 [subsurface metagenome]